VYLLLALLYSNCKHYALALQQMDLVICLPSSLPSEYLVNSVSKVGPCDFHVQLLMKLYIYPVLDSD
jgi:hypothetical protein